MSPLADPRQTKRTARQPRGWPVVEMLWRCVGIGLDAVERTLKPHKQLPAARQAFLCSPRVACLALVLLAASIAIGIDLYLSNAALPMVGAWWLLPSLLTFALMGRGLRTLEYPGSITVPTLEEQFVEQKPTNDTRKCLQERFYIVSSPQPPPV